jgi:hypothetical protein
MRVGNEMEDRRPELYQPEEAFYDNVITLEKWREWTARTVMDLGDTMVAFVGMQIWYDVIMRDTSDPLIACFDPTPDYETALDGVLGSIDGVLIIVDHFLHPLLQLLDPNEMLITCIDADDRIFSSESIQLALSVALDQGAKILRVKRSLDLKQWTTEVANEWIDDEEAQEAAPN